MRGTILVLALLAGAAVLPAQNLAGVKAIAADGNTGFALLSDGTVWGWGANSWLGDGTSTHQTARPVQVSGLTGVVAISHGLAVTNDGTVWQWGGNLNTSPSGERVVINKTPARVDGLGGVAVVAGGWVTSLALKRDGTVWAWGLNNHGMLGDLGDPVFEVPRPAQIRGLTDVVAIATGRWHSLAVKSDGTAWAWGDNSAGQLGTGLGRAIPGPRRLP